MKRPGRPLKGDEPRIVHGVSLTPRVWAFIEMVRRAHPGESRNDALERICRSHSLFCAEAQKEKENVE